MGIAEDIRADLRDAVRDVKARDLRVCLKDILAHLFQFAVLTDRDVGQLGAEIECVAIDPRHAVGDRDGGQAAVAKGTPADPIQLRAFFEAHALQLAAPVEVKSADVGDILADDDLLDLLLICFPRGLVCIVVRHGTAAVDRQRTFIVQLPSRVVAAAASGNDLHGNGASRVCEPIFLCVALCIGVFSHRQGHTLRCIQEKIYPNEGNTIRDIQALQVRVALEHITAHFGQLTILTNFHTR